MNTGGFAARSPGGIGSPDAGSETVLGDPFDHNAEGGPAANFPGRRKGIRSG
jgi:hypothetical protein